MTEPGRLTGDVRQAAIQVLQAALANDKVSKAREVQAAWQGGHLGTSEIGRPVEVPERPARPSRPELVLPGQVPRRRLSGSAGRIALLHAVAHIEFNAIDLAFDMVARFAGSASLDGLDRERFVDDWLGVGVDEARHFEMIKGRLSELGAGYGDLPAHDGLWTAARETADSLLARLAIAPMVLEARGLDVTPGMIERLDSAGDHQSADVLRVILAEEVGHVACGARWFRAICTEAGLDAAEQFRQLVRTRFRGGLKPPFNVAARARAGLEEGLYTGLSS